MENKNNRIFFNKDIDISTYVKHKKDYIRFITRFKDADIPKLKEIFKDYSFGYDKKKENAEERDKVKKFKFEELYFNNAEARDMKLYCCIIICKNENDVNEIKNLLNSNFDDVRYINTGKAITTHINNDLSIRGDWVCNKNYFIKYPICILSYKRANQYGRSHLFLCKCKIKHNVFCEPFEKEEYEKWINKEYGTLIVCPENFSKRDMGSTPVRNYILDWGKENNHNRVWMLDDNIKNYQRLYEGDKNIFIGDAIFSTIENYISNKSNIGLVSHNFGPFVKEGDCRSVIVPNGKCYSSMLISTNEDFRFRYKHQEDNLISIEYINKGLCNLCFNHILYNKETSGKDKGGNHEGIYKIKDKNTDGEGYKERYEYFENILWKLFNEGKLLFNDASITPDNFISRSTTMKSKEYHAKLEYGLLKGADNKIIHKNNNVKTDKRYENVKEEDLTFIPYENNEIKINNKKNKILKEQIKKDEIKEIKKTVKKEINKKTNIIINETDKIQQLENKVDLLTNENAELKERLLKIEQYINNLQNLKI